QGWGWNFALPTGPMILLSAAGCCFISFLFAPKSGFVRRILRAAYFRRECQRENILKYLWKKREEHFSSPKELKKAFDLSWIRIFWLLFCLVRQGWIMREGNRYALSADGRKRASHIVRLHRLWEVYLVYL